jgi:hypothetical protein
MILKILSFGDCLYYGFLYAIVVLALLYIVSIVWLASIHIYSISKFLTLFIYATVKDWTLRLFGKKEKTQSSSMELEFNDLEIHLGCTIKNETAPQTSIKPKSSQAKPQKKSYEKKPPTFRC